MDMPTAESQDGPLRLISSENDQISETGKQILLVETS